MFLIIIYFDSFSSGSTPVDLMLKTDKQQGFEDEALVTALRDTFLPRMQNRDASVFSTFVSDLWPDLDLPMIFGGDSDRPGQPMNPNHSILTELKTPRSNQSQKSLKGGSL